MGILHKKLNLVDALFHDPGENGVYELHVKSGKINRIQLPHKTRR